MAAAHTGNAERIIPSQRRTCAARPWFGGRALTTLLATTTLAAQGAGCVANSPVSTTDYLVAAAVQTVPAAGSTRPIPGATTEGDPVSDAAALGFDMVVATYRGEDLSDLLNAAGPSGLRVGVRVAAIDAYVATGSSPPTAASAESPAPDAGEFVLPTAMVRHPAFAFLVVPAGAGDAARARSARICHATAAINVPCLRFDVSAGPVEDLTAAAAPASSPPPLRPARVQLTADMLAEATPHEALLRQYHGAILGGRTDGLLVTGLPREARRAGGEPETRTPAVRAALAELCTRCRAWRGRIAGGSAESLDGPPANVEELKIAVLRRGPRAAALIYNTSDRFVRTEARLPARIGDRTFARAVEAPTGADQLPGAVYTASGGRLTIPVALRPGDAALYELF